MRHMITPRLQTLIGTVIAQFALGSVYTWSLFNAPLAEKLAAPVNQVAFSFGLLTLALALASSVSGLLQKRFGVRRVTIAAGLVLSLGLLWAGQVSQVWLLYVSAGLILGFADGTGYLMTLSNCVRFFPERKGLASACAIGAYGLGSLGFKYINLYFLEQSGVSMTFTMWALIAGSLVVLGGLLMHDAPIQTTSQVNNSSDQRQEYSLQQSTKTPQFWLLATVFFTICMSGLYVIGVAKDVGELQVHLSTAAAASSVAILAMANLAGRLVLGILSDKMERRKVVGIALLICTLGVSILLFVPLNEMRFFMAIACVAFSFGGAITVFPTLVSDYFGLNSLTQNYGVIYLGFGLGSFFGSMVASLFGGFEATFSVMLLLLGVSLCIALWLRAPKETQSTAIGWQASLSSHTR
ncbi:MFS transporter [Vibrio sp. V27_P1S3P104]|uniref:OFA family MFS transporter n=1 Tax=unclassified Vibrio TaxID=2614977 RepID=UPI001372F4F1|nr:MULTISPECIES: OFA family MFS transporter [unclassified Vibrio]NAW70336.1 MFS transporter [Vibrio sp. V28_P6S34P95]NAX06090.1 MFS transporter [Vibrio sp. V30_P3S12P165]NAX35690.1 MFS transporter [Vibrio sp. V29_P1S30P107]NAX36289.1 MFS transporter [Vibrio sp. V27_P1S3P104]NAX40037.1 MFS transporter [Vibrio sp. V26_P1S5P106]